MDAPTRPAGFDQVGPAPVGLGALAGLREAAIGYLHNAVCWELVRQGDQCSGEAQRYEVFVVVT